MIEVALKTRWKNSKLSELNAMIKKNLTASWVIVMLSKRKKDKGEFFEFRFHEIILGLDLTALPAWLVRQARIFGSFFS